MPLGPSFETIVRPVVMPDFRPSPARKIVVFDDPGQGFAIIHGNPAKQLNLTTSMSVSISRSNGSETERRVDQARIYQVDDQGNINKDNFVDIQVATRLRVKKPTGTETTYYRPIQQSDNIDVQKRDLIYNTPAGGLL